MGKKDYFLQGLCPTRDYVLRETRKLEGEHTKTRGSEIETRNISNTQDKTDSMYIRNV